MSGEVALSLEGVWKQFNRRGSGAPTLHAVLANPVGYWRERERFWALRDVNLTLRAGETVGVIGPNGSGKSTLLRLASGLGKPTRGRVVRRRSVGAMLSLGESFDGLLTGRENAVTALILAGYTRREAEGRLGEIVAFAELDEFFDDPVRTYSTGMTVRLAFAAAMSAEPEVLLIDEVLAVGDLRFQQKCVERLEELRTHGTTILFASHDESQVRAICERVVWLAHGHVQAYGDPEEVYAAYKDATRAETERRAAAVAADVGRDRDGLRMNENRFGTLEVEVVDVRILPSILRRAPSSGPNPIRIEIDLHPHVTVEDPIVVISLHRLRDGGKVLDVNTAADGITLGRLERPTTVTLRLDRFDAEAGAYRFDVGVFEASWSYAYDYHWQAYDFDLVDAGMDGTFGPSRGWSLG
jgi:lipopolysaccharide transport system ATP-binding protein